MEKLVLVVAMLLFLVPIVEKTEEIIDIPVATYETGIGLVKPTIKESDVYTVESSEESDGAVIYYSVLKGDKTVACALFNAHGNEAPDSETSFARGSRNQLIGDIASSEYSDVAELFSFSY